MTRKEIEKFSGVEPNCFETDREEYWYKIGYIDGLNAADTEPDCTLLWHNMREEQEELPQNNEEILVEWNNGDVTIVYTRDEVFYRRGNLISMNNIKQWAYIKDLLPKTK